jgi:transposase-like protein
MDDRIRTVQKRIRAVQREHPRGQTRYPPDLRAEIMTVVRAGRAAGRSIRRLARILGVSAPTLTTWLRAPSQGALRQVTVAPETIPALAPPGRTVLVTPHGVRVEGLDVAGVITVLRALA